MTWGVERTIQHTGDMLESCTAETYIILLTNVTPINSTTIKNINLKKKKLVSMVEIIASQPQIMKNKIEKSLSKKSLKLKFAARIMGSVWFLP